MGTRVCDRQESLQQTTWGTVPVVRTNPSSSEEGPARTQWKRGVHSYAQSAQANASFLVAVAVAAAVAARQHCWGFVGAGMGLTRSWVIV